VPYIQARVAISARRSLRVSPAGFIEFVNASAAER